MLRSVRMGRMTIARGARLELRTKRLLLGRGQLRLQD